MVELRKILEDAVSRKASDIHLAAGSPPAFRVDGKMQFVGETPLDPHETEALLDEVLNPRQKAAFLERRDYDLAVSIPGLGRFRTNVLTQRGSVGYVFRHVSGKILSFQDLHLPPVVGRLRIPIVATGHKQEAEQFSRSALEEFLAEHCHEVPGSKVLLAEFHGAFHKWLPAEDCHQWGKIKTSRAMPTRFPVGAGTDNKKFIGNLAWEKPGTLPADAKRYVRIDGKLRLEGD